MLDRAAEGFTASGILLPHVDVALDRLPIAYAPMIMPSSTACGLPSMMLRSMNAPGSPSSALQMTYFVSPWASRQARHLRPVGNPAPPRPRSPAARSASMIASGLHRGQRLNQGRVAADGDVVADVGGVDLSGVRQAATAADCDKTGCPARTDGPVAGLGTAIQEPLHDTPAKHGFVHDLRDVGRLDVPVEDTLRVDDQQRSAFAEALAARLLEARRRRSSVEKTPVGQRVGAIAATTASLPRRGSRCPMQRAIQRASGLRLAASSACSFSSCQPEWSGDVIRSSWQRFNKSSTLDGDMFPVVLARQFHHRPEAHAPTQLTMSSVTSHRVSCLRPRIPSCRSISSRTRVPPRTWQAVPMQTLHTCLPRGSRLNAL